MKDEGWVAIGLFLGIPVGVLIGYMIAKGLESPKDGGMILERDERGRIVGFIAQKGGQR